MSLVKFVLNYYSKIPVEILNVAAPIYHLLPDSIRMGRVYVKEMREIRRIERLTPEEVQKEQNQRLQKMVYYSYEHVPYYRKLFDENGISPEEITCAEDLSKIPFLTKELLVKHYDELISDEFSEKDMIPITTSGSTGVPTRFYVENDSHMRDVVYVYHMFRYLGYSSKSSRLILRGKMFQSQRKEKNWQWDAFRRNLSINVFSMTEENMEVYCQAIEKHKPDFAYGYLSAMYSLCKYIEKRGGLKHQFKGFIGISEMIHTEQKDYVEQIIQAPVVSFYGMSERVIIAGMCPHSAEYHVEPLYGITEIVDDAGNVITQPGEVGELVGTGLLNYAMPLLRYKTGDMSSYSSRESCKCGSYKRRLSSIEGRSKLDQLIGKSGVTISLAAINVHADVFKRIYRYQFFQDTIGKVVVKIVPNPMFVEADFSGIIDAFIEKTKDEIEFTLEVCEELVPKKNGKFSLIDQRLDVSEYL